MKRLAVFLFLIFLASCSPSNSSKVFKWSGISLDERFSNVVYSLDIPNTNLASGLLFVKANVSQKDYENFLIEYSFRKVLQEDRFYIPSYSHKNSWWAPESKKQSDWFIRPHSGPVLYRQQVFWYKGTVYMFQNGPFEVGGIRASYSERSRK